MVEVNWKPAESIHWGERKLMLGQLFNRFIFVSKFVIVFSFEVLLVVVIASLLSCENSFGTVCHLSIEYSMGAR